MYGNCCIPRWDTRGRSGAVLDQAAKAHLIVSGMCVYHTAKQLLARYKRAPSAESSPCLVSRQSGGMWAMTGTLLSPLENTAEKQRLSDSSTIMPTLHQLPVPCDNMRLVSAIETDHCQNLRSPLTGTWASDRKV